MNMDGNSSCILENSTCKVQITEGVGYTILFLLGLVLNATELWAFMVKRNSWTDTHIYLINLTVADLILILFLPFRIYDALYCLEVTTLCTALMSVHYVNMYASILTSTAISVHRFLVVRFPFHARSWRKKKQAAFTVCLAIWTVVVSLCVFSLLSESNHPNKLWRCFERRKDKPLEPILLVTLLTVCFLAPLLIIVLCSSQILWTLAREKDDSAEKKRVTSIVTANMIVFIVCYTPFHVSLLMNNINAPPTDWEIKLTSAHIFLLVSEWLATANCCLDFISYYCLLKGFHPLLKEGTLVTPLPFSKRHDSDVL